MYLGARPETRLMYNNALNSGTVISSTQEVTGFPVENIVKDSRTSLYIPNNIYIITASNKTFKITHNSVDYTITIAEGSYLADALATEIESKFNTAVSSSTYDVAFSSTTGLFGIKNTTYNFTLKTSEDTASWDVIGFVYPSNLVCILNSWYYGSRVRRNSGVFLKYDLGGSADCSFFALLGEKNKTISLTSNAIVNLRLSNIDDYATAEININVPVAIDGCYAFIDGINPLPEYRYVWIDILDKENPNEYLIFSQLFIGGYVGWDNRTINNGFGIQYVDKSIRVESVSGSLFFEKYPKYPYLTGLTIAYLTKAQLDLLQQAWFDLGKSQHFYISLDSGHLNNDLSQLTWYGVLESDPQITNVAPRYYNASFTFRGD